MKLVSESPRQDADDANLRLFADALPCIVWVANAAGHVQWCSRGFQEYTGMTPEATLAWGWMPSVHPEDREAMQREWGEAQASGAILDAIGRLRGVDGMYRWFGIGARPFRESDGSISKWFGTLTDIHFRQMALESNIHVVDALMKGFLSNARPVAQGVTFDKLYRAANILEKLGGDWYDLFELPGGRIGFSIGDVCGHGIDAAVKMGEAKQAIFVAASLGDPAPESVLRTANDVLFLNDQVSITTALYGMIDTVRRTVTYASAGHHPPVLAAANGQAQLLPNHGFPLGVESQMPSAIRTHEFAYESGSLMILYTDGLIEFDHDMLHGEQRLLAAASTAVQSRPEHPARFIVDEVLGGSVAGDDIAVLVISFRDESK